MSDKKFTIIMLIIIFFLCLMGNIAFYDFNDHTIVATITDKERDDTTNEEQYLIFTKTKNNDVLVLGNYDNILRRKFNSSDIYGDLKIGSTYEFTVVGYRNPLLSTYKNILNYKLIENEFPESENLNYSDKSFIDIIEEMNLKVKNGYQVVMDFGETSYIMTGENLFIFNEEIVENYNISVNYISKIITLKLK